ncbi:molybdopterin oxidoreductase family protein [Archangium primigenium]|uniref:molybdopterin oxidoreductase family protein n=1 Tax=[Archangium] primigenium TaxID=2792470 RepID=UPI0019569806|nr:molybdopterin oxidoreductase family protein [Archangium primigenium]MBM7117902.1 molybdopterin oxidoreductase family protein [Archangium primigenium]
MEPRVDENLGIEGEPDRWVHSACLLCSNGCGLDIAVKDEKIVGVRGSARHPVNFGHLGPKGEHGWMANNHPRRGTQPHIRREKGAPLEPVSWKEAMDFFIQKFQEAWDKGHENLACYNSGQLMLEEYYALSKLWRGGLQSSNIDGNTRLCTATSATGLMANFGADGPVASYVDIDQAELLCLYGHNVAETQTVLWERMLAARRKNQGRILVVDPRKSPTVRQGADLHLQIKLGTNVALMNGLIHLLIREGHIDRTFVDRYTVGFEDMETTVRDYPPEYVAELCGIRREDLELAATWIGTTPRMVSTVLQGFYQSVEATAASSLVNSVHLLLGAIGKPGAGPLLMAGQPSAMSNREAGADGSYPAYRNPHNSKHMKELCDLWNLDFERFHSEVPKDITTMMEVAERGEIEFMWVIGTNPLVSMPDQNRTTRILQRTFLVVQDPFIDTETVNIADIYFPVAMWGEKTGCITNADRTVNLLLKAVEPPGQARTDFDLFVEVGQRLGFKDKDGAPLLPFRDTREAFEEWRRVSKGRPCDYSGLTYELILEKGAVRWPVNAEHPEGSERLYEDLKFWTGIDDCESYGADFLTGNKHTRDEYSRIDPKGKAFLKPARWRRMPNPTTKDYPFTLTTGRVVYHWHTRTKTARAPALDRRAPHAYVEVHPEDAARLGIQLGDIVEVTSVQGAWEGPALVVDTVRPGELFIPFHYGHGRQGANQHTWFTRDPVSQQPQFKSSPVQLQRKGFGSPEQWLVDRLKELQGESREPYAARALEGTRMTPVPPGS